MARLNSPCGSALTEELRFLGRWGWKNELLICFKDSLEGDEEERREALGQGDSWRAATVQSNPASNDHLNIS